MFEITLTPEENKLTFLKRNKSQWRFVVQFRKDSNPDSFLKDSMTYHYNKYVDRYSGMQGYYVSGIVKTKELAEGVANELVQKICTMAEQNRQKNTVKKNATVKYTIEC